MVCNLTPIIRPQILTNASAITAVVCRAAPTRSESMGAAAHPGINCMLTSINVTVIAETSLDHIEFEIKKVSIWYFLENNVQFLDFRNFIKFLIASILKKRHGPVNLEIPKIITIRISIFPLLWVNYINRRDLSL